MKIFSKKNLFMAVGGLIAVSAASLAWAQGPVALSPDSAPAAASTMMAAPDAEMPTQPMMPEPQPSAMPTEASAAPVLAPPEDAAPPKKSKKSAGVKAAPMAPVPPSYLVVKKERDANEFDARLTAARTALAQGQNGAALEMFNNLYAQYPKDSRVQVGRAVSMQRVGKIDEALAAYEDALNNDPRNLEALTNMLGILNGQESATALDKLKQLAQVYPFNADIAAQLGMMYGQNGDYANAVKFLNVADNLKPGNVAVLYNRAIAYDKMGHRDEAVSLYRKLVQLSSDGVLDPSYPVEAIRKRLAALN